MSSRPAIGLTALTKRFVVGRPRTGTLSWLRRPVRHTVTAVDQLSFTVEPGERVAFIGPNGAGKSTTLKMLAGVLHPDAGEATVLGHVPWRDRHVLAFEIGTVFGQRSQLWYDLPPRATFELLRRVYDVPTAEYRRRLALLVDAFDLGSVIETPVRQLSLGQRMRAEIAASCLHGPRLLFLDEPTIGLDVSAKAAIRHLLRTTCEQTGATLVLTSHDTVDIEQLCERAIVIDHGRLVWDGSIAELRRRYVTARRVTIWSDRETLEVDLPGVRVVARRPYEVEVEVEPSTTPVAALIDTIARKGAVRDLAIADPSLEDVIRRFYRESAVRS